MKDELLAAWEADAPGAGLVYADWLEEQGDPTADGIRWLAERDRFPRLRRRRDEVCWTWEAEALYGIGRNVVSSRAWLGAPAAFGMSISRKPKEFETVEEAITSVFDFLVWDIAAMYDYASSHYDDPLEFGEVFVYLPLAYDDEGVEFAEGLHYLLDDCQVEPQSRTVAMPSGEPVRYWSWPLDPLRIHWADPEAIGLDQEWTSLRDAVETAASIMTEVIGTDE